MQEICPYGSVRGVPGNWHPYRDSRVHRRSHSFPRADGDMPGTQNVADVATAQPDALEWASHEYTVADGLGRVSNRPDTGDTRCWTPVFRDAHPAAWAV
jgi:hypothetical protein